MEISYWQSRWQKNNTGWHMQQVYPHLITFWGQLNLPKQSTVLVPLCGKSLDVSWLREQGHTVIAADVSKKAILELKSTLNIDFTQKSIAHFEVFSSERVQLWVGDFLKIKPDYIPQIDAIYDKAALIALPPHMRKKYAAVLKKLVQPHTQMLLNCFEYNQQEMTGPPFAVFKKELEQYYGEQFSMRLLYQESIMEQLSNFKRRGLSSFLDEKVYVLSPVKE